MKPSTLYLHLQKQLKWGTESSEPLLNRLLRIANDYLRSPVGFIYVYDSEAESLIFHLGYNCHLEDVELSVLSLSGSASGQVVREQRTTDFPHIQTEGTYLCKDFARRHSLQRYFATPLLDSHYQVIGVLGLHPPSNLTITRRQKEHLVSVSRIMALALEALRAKEREAQVLHLSKLGNMLTTRGNLRTINMALDQVRESVGAEQVFYFESSSLEVEHVAKSPTAVPISRDQLWQLAQRSLETKLPTFEALDGIRVSPAMQVFLTACPVQVHSKPRGFLVFVNTFQGLRLPSIPSLSKDRGLIELVASLFEIFLENLLYLASFQEEEERRHALTLSLSHEFIIPVTGIAARVDKLKKKCAPFFDDKNRSSPPFVYFDDISHALEDLQELTTGILSLTEEACNFRPSHLYGPIILRVVDLLKHQAQRKKIEIVFDAQEFLDSFPKIFIDKTLITHVFYNVVKNAVKYSYRGTPIKLRA